jgi:hypothetical protein
MEACAKQKILECQILKIKSGGFIIPSMMEIEDFKKAPFPVDGGYLNLKGLICTLMKKFGIQSCRMPFKFDKNIYETVLKNISKISKYNEVWQFNLLC